MENYFLKIMELSKSRMIEFIETKREWYKWHSTYLEQIIGEFEEAKEEIKSWKKVYLEDELWDILWCYCCLINSLELEWKIEAYKVIERCDKKFHERILWVRTWWEWENIKEKQKEELRKEQEKINK